MIRKCSQLLELNLELNGFGLYVREIFMKYRGYLALHLEQRRSYNLRP